MSVLDLPGPRGTVLSLPRTIGGALVLLVAAFALLGPVAVPGDPFAQVLMKALSGQKQRHRWDTTTLADPSFTAWRMPCVCRP